MDLDSYSGEVVKAKDNAAVLWKYNSSIGLFLFPTLLVTLPLAITLSVMYAYKLDRLETQKAIRLKN